MCLTEYDEDAERKFIKNEGRKEGIAEGLEKGLEKGRKEGLSEGRKEGLKEGLSEGRRMEAERMDRLVSELLKANRIEDLKKATSDSEFKNKLFREFNL